MKTKNKHSKHMKNTKANNPEELKRVSSKKKKEFDKTIVEKTRKHKKLKLTILAIIIISIIVLGIKMAISANNFKKLIIDMAKNENSIIVDSDGNTITKIGTDKAKTKIDFNQIPDNLKNAYIAIEDERYYKHNGVDIKRTASASASYIFHRGSSSFGGSTITQQLVKNLTGNSDGTISRKVDEWGKAINIESFMSKDEILELYLNIIYVGPNIYGVDTGAQYYFSKSAEDLSLEECAFLAGINISPNSYNPFDSENNEKIKKRVKTVLSKMLELKYISNDEYDKALSKVETGLKFKKGSISTDDSIYSYHTDALITQLIEDLSERKHISQTFASNYIDMAGLTIYSAQNTTVQKEIENEFEKTKYQLSSNNGNEHSQAAMIVIDHKTGEVKGCVGGLGKKTSSRCFNRATQSIRQTGSAIKPIAVLVPGISKKSFTASSIFLDEQQMFADEYNPENYSNYLGDITVRRAIESSQNIPFVEMMQKITPKASMKYLKKMGITTLTERDDNLALALGGLDKGISPLEMAGAYGTIANDGVYIEPTFYTKVVNSSNSIIIQAKQKKRKVFSKEVAYIVKELLTQPVNGAYGTATYCTISGTDVAAKTGTTDENYDRWLCGFTPYYTAVTWYGYDQNETISYNGKKNPAGILWANIMSKIHTKLPNSSFEKPSTVIKVTVCSETGKKANSGCPDTYEEYFLWNTIPNSCDKHTGSGYKNINSNTTNTTKTDSFDMTTKDDLDIKIEDSNTNTVNNVTTEKNTTNNIQNNTNELNNQNNTTTKQQNVINNNSNQTTTTTTTTTTSINNVVSNQSSSTSSNSSTQNTTSSNVVRKENNSN